MAPSGAPSARSAPGDGLQTAANGRLASVSAASVALAALTAALASALLFLAEPMTGKMLLPHFGGTPLVWAISLVFFQLAVLAGYLLAHLSGMALAPRRQAAAFVALLALAALSLPPRAPGGSWVGADVTAPLLFSLAHAVALPFVALAACGTLLQIWLARGRTTAAGNPYALYACTSAGSIVGLLAYPLLLEPRLGLHAQARLWSALYVAVLLLTATSAAALLRPAPLPLRASPHERPSRRTAAAWFATAAAPGALLVAATTHVTAEVSPLPLFWVLPLALYLLSFSIAFACARLPLPALATACAVVVTAAAAALATGSELPTWVQVALPSAAVFAVALVAHGRLAASRPEPSQLTVFYVAIAAGSAGGGLLSALVAPRLFDSPLEYPLSLAAGLLLAPAVRRRRRGRAVAAAVATAVAALAVVAELQGSIGRSPSAGEMVACLAAGGLVLAVAAPVRMLAAAAAIVLIVATAGQRDLLVTRDTAAVLRVEQRGRLHVLMNGTTVHGVESFAPGRVEVPLGYYGRGSPVGHVFSAFRGELRRVAVVGLGAGTLAAYGRPGDSYTFFDVDPAVVRIARDGRLFRYLAQSRAHVRVRLVDGRLGVEELPPRSLDLLVVDAFDSDSVPVHLLTLEALRSDLARLHRGGLLAVHISSRYLNLGPVVTAAARRLGVGELVADHAVSPAAARRGELSSRWAVLSSSRRRLRRLAEQYAGWQTPASVPASQAWTDDRSDLLDVVRWS